MFWWLLTLAWADPATGPVDVMLLWPIVSDTVEIGSVRSGLPNTVQLVPGEHRAVIKSPDGREQVKLITVSAEQHPENMQVIDLAKAQAASVPGGRFELVRPGWEGRTVYVDGIEAGVLPAVVVLSAGTHVVEVAGAEPEAERARFELPFTPADDTRRVTLR